MSSIKEVAKQAHVSVATVSRVLNNDPVVKPATKNKVLQVIKEMNYKPNLLAKNLRKQASRTVVMVLPSMSNPYFSEIARGAQAAAYDKGYNIIIGTIESKRWILDTYINMLKTNLAEGIVFVSSSVSKELLETLVDEYSVVLCTEYYPGINAACVAIDNKKAGYEAARELIRRGHTHIAYIAGSSASSSVAARIEGYKEALNEAGIPFRPELIAGAKNKFEHVKEIVNGILGQGMQIDGILTHSDLQASYVLKGIKEKSIGLSDEVGLVSFDGTFVAEITNPTLTSIVQPLYDLGYTSVCKLIEKLQGESGDEEEGLILLPHHLEVRET
ncbi:LacI family DNA-binding transcriptional regulator [Paenibacillus oceani]|uniref:LacI family DNA-binding transcriptional regulator n=1 Tax=Paenibacillus oceani TaxID=2772510 RepID=A0A927CCT2_9BACL|nr:LacI family DNA-binding transcriptional regulator [Paenibacillus oceani]MBD2864232.1 LacI family DNA-binding transcriptional regulator [Paenibacillus oceani]